MESDAGGDEPGQTASSGEAQLVCTHSHGPDRPRGCSVEQPLLARTNRSQVYRFMLSTGFIY